mgnify:CR=1 FL=1
MKDIIEVYSDAIISVICAVAVITLFVNDRIQGYYPGVFESDYIQIVIGISM